MSRPWTQQWFDDCEHWLGRVLDGKYRHWCNEWDGLPVDETMPEFESCLCFHCKCRTRMQPKYYPLGRQVMEVHDDVWKCPKMRFWNFWKHTQVNLYFDYIP